MPLKRCLITSTSEVLTMLVVVMKYIVCFSGGHSSALCAIECVRKVGKENVVLLNHNISEEVEDKDIKRFKQEIADYLGIKTRKSITSYINGKRKVPKRYEGIRACTLDDIPMIENGTFKRYDKNTDHFDRTFDRDKSGHYCKKVVQLNLDGSFVKEFQSIKEASEEFHVRDSTILRVCQGINKTSCGFIWKYKEEYDNKTN